MNGTGEGVGSEDRRGGLIATLKSRYRTFAIVAAVTLSVDFLVLKWVVPWANEEFSNPIMSVGYIITFFVVFSNVVVFFALVAYLLHGDSYPSDRWT